MRFTVFTAILLMFPMLANAETPVFSMGPVFEKFGQVADVETDFEIPTGTQFRVSFDVAKGANEGEHNRTLVSAARFVNMHARASAPLDDIDVAIVVHGKAVLDVTNPLKYEDEIGGDNVNRTLVAALIEQGVRIIVCGQSAAHQNVTKTDLLPGVEMALSAMTAHAVLQRDGYTLNPF
ncbi:DsrE family protein [Hyphococcus lacteus]|uniref:DsrE family protein n=1 Tax=Hyphococcus lacteus TaxID=3143536 RepID=A0ABV3Z747_9PROT